VNKQIPATTPNATTQARRGERFRFGKNWRNFLRTVDETSVLRAQAALVSLLGRTSLEGLSFLDIGSGSGIHSLAAWRLGARVVAFDYDSESVTCTCKLKERFAAEDERWQVLEGSILDAAFLSSLGLFEIVYSWGVLHHTGDMWTAVRNAAERTTMGGLFAVALYNDQGVLSRYWRWEKRLFNRRSAFQMASIVLHLPTVFCLPMLIDALRGAPKDERGMKRWYDYLDWLGGYPFEVASPDAVFRFLREQFDLVELRTQRGNSGCNEFVFRRRFKDV
jgi:2-polyprenyl-6-hydroxyphenyl methylase/3-demethylubiquinone-9 3-methyltransferase